MDRFVAGRAPSESRDISWALARTRYAAEPTAERPDGAVIATTAPEAGKGQPVRLIDLGP